MKREEKFILLLGPAILLVLVIGAIIQLHIAFNYPGITYRGDRSVPEKEIIHLEKLTLRDLELDESSEFSGKKHYYKYYIIKKNFLSKKKREAQLREFCIRTFHEQNCHDEMAFFFYEECGTMPWFWDSSKFPDLEMNSNHRIAAFWVTDESVSFRPHY